MIVRIGVEWGEVYLIHWFTLCMAEIGTKLSKAKAMS